MNKFKKKPSTDKYRDEAPYNECLVCAWCEAEDPSIIYVDDDGAILGCSECVKKYDLKEAMEKFPHLIERRTMKPLYCLIGKSGSGKDTIADELSHIFGYKKVLSYTTREPRSNRDRLNHNFGDIEMYKKHLDDGEVVADTVFDGNYYWSTYQQLDDSDLYIVDPEGYFKLLNNYQRLLIPIYIHAEDPIRFDRMKKRGDSELSIVCRQGSDAEKFKDIDNIKFAICVINNEKPLRDIINKLKLQILAVGGQIPDETIVVE